MLGFFPSMNDDELLFSILARYHCYSGNTNIKGTIKEIYAKNSICAVVDFPCNLDILVENIPLNNIDSDVLIDRHTLLPYYKPFLPDKCYLDLKKVMKGSNSINKIHMSLGIPASRISYPEKLRYCEKCYKQEVTKYGQAYWHRVHQLPGVIICNKHNCFLRNSFVEMHVRKNKHEYIPLDKSVTNRNSIELPSDVNRDLLLYISKETSLILNGIEKLPNLTELKEIIRYQLKEKGFVTFTNRVRFKELINEINRFCGISTLKLLQVDLDDNLPETWIHKFVRGKAKKEHPLRYMVLFYFLGKISLGNLGKTIGCMEDYIFKPPFPCLNKAAHHYREFIMNNVEIKRESKTGLPIGTFTCVCGFSYSRRGPDTSEDDKFRIGRIKSFGQLWFIKLHELLQESISMREIARILGVDATTVIKYSKIEPKKLNIISLEKSSNFEMNRILLKKEIPDSTRSITSKTKVDWEKRDKDLAFIIYKTSIELIKSDYHGRVTKSLLRRLVGHRCLLEKKINKLVLSKIVLIMFSESYIEHQDRRIKRVIKDLQNKNIKIKKWRIIRNACLGSTVSRVINKKIDGYLDSFND